jgi:hypothetical protein
MKTAVVHARARTSIGMFTEDGGSGSAEPASVMLVIVDSGLRDNAE